MNANQHVHLFNVHSSPKGIVGPASISAILSSSLVSQDPPKPTIDKTSKTTIDSLEPLISVQPVSSSAFVTDKFRIVEGEDLKTYLDRLESREGKAPASIPDDEPMEAGPATTSAVAPIPDVPAQGGTEASGGSGGMETD